MDELSLQDLLPKKPSLFDEVMKFWTQKRVQLQDWEANPPIKFSWLVFGVTTFETALARTLLDNNGGIRGLVSTWFGTMAMFLLLEFLFLKTAEEVGRLFNKGGKLLTAFTFLHISLLPLGLFLPLAVLVYLKGGLESGLWLLFFLLALKVISNWRESVEIAFELTRLHSAIVVYALGILGSLLVGAGVYFSIIKTLSEEISPF